MVFVDKSLDKLLEEIDYKEPINLPEICYESKDRNKSYLIESTYLSYQETAVILEKINGELASWFECIPNQMSKATGALSELISNALEWGGGIKEVDYYFAPKGAIVDIIQDKEWNYKEVLAKLEKGLYPSSRKETEDTTMHGGGCGLSSSKCDKYEVSYNTNHTHILFLKELVESKIRK